MSPTSPDADDPLDEVLEETFPASDSPANTVETGIRAIEPLPPSDRRVSDNRRLKRFELSVDGAVAFLTYERAGDSLTLIHTEVPEELRGHHLGEALIESALTAARSDGLRIVPLCPFVRAYLRKHRTSILR
jgi:predicted GNAT family acetyltransferase